VAYDVNRRIGEIRRERRRQARAIRGTTAGAVTVGSGMMSRRERIGGIVEQMQTYIVNQNGTVTQSEFDLYGTSRYGISTYGK